MNKAHTIEFAVTKKNGIVTQIGKSSILQPKPSFKGGTVKWHEDRKKEAGK